MMLPKADHVLSWSRQHWRRLASYGAIGLAAVFLLVQLIYPGNLLVPFASIDGQSVAMRDKSEVKRQIETIYKKQPLALYFGSAKEAYRTPTPDNIGLAVNIDTQIKALEYPLWLRLVPTSILWAHVTRGVVSPTYTHNDEQLQAYMAKELGESCDVTPKDATLKIEKTKLVIVPSSKGGTCKLNDVHRQLAKVTPRLGTKTEVHVPMNERDPAIGDKQARDFRTQLEARIKDGVTVRAGNDKVVIPRDQLLTWLDFVTADSHIAAVVNAERSGGFVGEQLAPKVARAAGVSKVSTQDFVETSRVNGAPGAAIDTPATLASLGEYLTKGSEAVVVTKSVAPRVEYTRSYSPTDVGLSALLQQYAQSHPGTFGISLVELSGQRRRAAYQDTKQFHTASTYKLFVAYGALKRVESGVWHWSDQIDGGRNLEKCLDDMIVKSDNPCGETMLKKIGYSALTNELRAVGLNNSSFMGGNGPQSTAGDLSTFNAALESGQLLSPESKNRLIGLMKRNIYRQGVPAGANGTVANKVGFLDGLLHDAAIIYGPTGPVALTVMTDGSSWATIADLTRQIETLRAQ